LALSSRIHPRSCCPNLIVLCLNLFATQRSEMYFFEGHNEVSAADLLGALQCMGVKVKAISGHRGNPHWGVDIGGDVQNP